jgi:hypothetical protein
MTKEMNIDLVALTKQDSAHCYTLSKDGTKIPDYRTVIIRVHLEDGSRKVYRISRHKASKVNPTQTIEHCINSYKVIPNSYQTDAQANRIKWYNAESFDKKLTELAKEIAKLNYTIEAIL